MSLGAKGEIILDTNAVLHFLLRLDAATLAQLKASKFRFIIAAPAFNELFITDNFETVYKDILELRRVHLALGDQLRIGLEPVEVFRREHRQQLYSTPLWPKLHMRKFFQQCGDREHVEFIWVDRESYKKLQSDKDRHLQADKVFKSRAKAEIGKTNEILQEISSYNGPVTESWLLSQVISLYLPDPEKITPLQVLAQKGRYKAALTWVCLGELTSYGNALPQTCLDPIAAMLRTSHGNWYDNAVACTAAHAKALITDDARLLGKCNFLHKRGLVQFQAFRCKDFIDYIASDISD